MPSLAHLITIDHIEAARRNGGRFTKVIDEQYTIKVGKQVNRAQYDILCHVYASGAIPCPRPVEFVEMSDGVNAVVMSTVEGVELGWAMAKRLISNDQLGDLCEELVKSMNGVHQYMIKHRPHDRTRIHSIAQSGPLTFPLVSRFLPQPVRVASFVDTMSSLYPQLNDELFTLQRALLSSMADGEIVFCHMDIHIRNVMVKDGKLSALLDWDHAGWYTRAMEVYSMVDIGMGLKDVLTEGMIKAWGMCEEWSEDRLLQTRQRLREGYRAEEKRRNLARASAFVRKRKRQKVVRNGPVKAEIVDQEQATDHTVLA